MKSRILCGASAMTLTVFASLWASQTIAAEAPAAPAAAAPSPAAPSEAAAAPETTIGELVVTAEKRSQNLQTVPVAVSAFTAKDRDLKGISSFQDLSDYAPGLSFNTLTDRPYIRGIGRDTDNLATESGVAIYYDGIYYGANASILLQMDTLFVDRIEILRGPQSTLYGRNADGGSINYITRRPSDEFQGEVRAGWDNYAKFWYEGMVTGPLAKGLDLLLGGNYTSQTGGYFNNLNGAPEGGSVTQGGAGWSYHAEAQLKAELGDHVEAWLKLGSSDFNATFHTQALQGPFGDTEFPTGALFPNVFYGLCALPGGSGGLGCTSTSSPDTIVPGSVVTLPNTIATNPALTNLRDFDADFKSSSKESNNIILGASLVWHAPSFDVKYLGGYQTFNYDLNFPFAINLGPTTGVESYQLAAPSTPSLGCLVVFGGNAGCTQPLTVNPAGEDLSFIENEYFFSNELDFSSTNNGPVQWIAGLYWYHEHYDQPINVFQPNQPQIGMPINGPPNPTNSAYSEDTNLDEDSYAGFAQVDWHVTPTIKLTGGLRYTADHKYGFEQFRAVEFGLPITVVPGCAPGSPAYPGCLALGTFGASTMGANAPALDITSALAVPVDPTTGLPFPGTGAGFLDPLTGKEVRTLDAWWHGLTGTAGVEWQPDSETLVYGKYSRGYKTGGFNSGIIAPAPETLPEFVNAFEIGMKKTFFGNFQANLAAFYYDYQNDQVPLAVQGAAGPPTTFIFNVPSTHTYGFEAETIWRPINPLTLSLNYAFLSAKVASTNGICFEDVNDPQATQPGANISGCPVAAPGAPQGQNVTGANLPQAPHNKISANALYTIPFEPGSLTLSGSVIWKDGEYSSLFNRTYNYASPYTQVNLRATWTDALNRFSLIVFMDNVFNAFGTDGTSGQIVSPPGQNPTIVDRFVSLTAPRTYGMEIQYRFK